jgi:predicted DNA-binding transcriptional regulator
MIGGVGEGYKADVPGAKGTSSASVRLGELEYLILRFLVESGLTRFRPGEISRAFNLRDKSRRVCDALRRLIRRGMVAREPNSRGYYKLLMPLEKLAELLTKAIVQGPTSKVNGAVKGSDGTSPLAVPACNSTSIFPVAVFGSRSTAGVVGVFLDNVRGFTVSGSYVSGDRGGLLSFGDLARFSRVSYAELAVLTGTSLLEGLGVITMYYWCGWVGGVYACSDKVEWWPPSGLIKSVGVLEARRLLVNRVLPVGFGLVARALEVAGSPLKRVRAAFDGLARSLYRRLRCGCYGCVGPP